MVEPNISRHHNAERCLYIDYGVLAPNWEVLALFWEIDCKGFPPYIAGMGKATIGALHKLLTRHSLGLSPLS